MILIFTFRNEMNEILIERYTIHIDLISEDIPVYLISRLKFYYYTFSNYFYPGAFLFYWSLDKIFTFSIYPNLKLFNKNQII